MLETTLFKHRRRVLEGLKKSEGVSWSLLRASGLDYEGRKSAAKVPRSLIKGSKIPPYQSGRKYDIIYATYESDE